MSTLWIVFVFLNAWWVVLFAVLPWGVAPPETPVEGHAAGAPERPNIKKKLIVTTIIAIIITAALALLISSGIVPLRDTVQ